MAGVQFCIETIPMSPLGEPGELILNGGGGRIATREEERLLGVAERHMPRPPTVLPYRAQDSYGRAVEDSTQRTLTLENEHLRATFLLDLGARLWRLYDKDRGRELLHQPDTIQLANLAVRNAWFAGGVEWNLGVTGHWGLTLEPVCAGVVGDGVVRMWAYERLIGIVWRIDAWLPDGARHLAVRAVIHNHHPRPTPVYWWSNTAVPQTAGTRVITDATSAYHFGYAYALSEVDVPVRDGRDVSHPATHNGCADYFYRVTEPWMMAVDETGYGLGQSSTPQLAGRKLFTWGAGSGGRAWQRWLSGDGAYAEIQAGLAATQLEHLALPAGHTWGFTELYGPVQIPDPSAPWASLVNQGREHVVAAQWLQRADDYLASVANEAVAEPRFAGESQGWGAVEVAAGHLPANPATPFILEGISDEQRAWLALARNGELDAVLRSSAAVGPMWRARLEAAPNGWLKDLLLGNNAYAANRTVAAREHWQASLDAHPTPDAMRGLAWSENDDQRTASRLLAAHRMDPHRFGIAVEAVTALVNSGQESLALETIDNLAEPLASHPRIEFLTCLALVRTGQLDRAAELLNKPLMLPDLREGDLSLDRLWDEFQTLGGTSQPLPEYYDFRMVTAESQED